MLFGRTVSRDVLVTPTLLPLLVEPLAGLVLPADKGTNRENQFWVSAAYIKPPTTMTPAMNAANMLFNELPRLFGTAAQPPFPPPAIPPPDEPPPLLSPLPI